MAATTLDSRPSAATYDVEGLVEMAWTGKLRVPHFQRDFRWNFEDVRRLFDSIVKGYPIGSLLLWLRAAEEQTLQLGDLRIQAPASDTALWVVDGQQRLTSLANALHPAVEPHSRFALAYDLKDEQFVRTPASESSLVIPLPVLFNLQEILKWFARNPGISDYLDLATSITRRIRQFEVPAYLVVHNEPEVLQDIFDRMNSYGKRLSRAEIFSALNAGDEFQSDDTLTFERIAEQVDVDHSFGRIDNDTVLGAVLARRGSEVRRDIRTEFSGPGDEGRDAAYKAGAEAIHRTVVFLQNDVGVPHVTMLAYRYLLVVLARVFAFFPDPDPRNRQLLRRWYWRAATLGPEHFKGGTPNAARVLCSKVDQSSLSASVQDLLAAVESDVTRIPDLSRFATNEAATKIVLCAWWAAGPRNPMTGEQYEQSDLAETLTGQQTPRDAVHYIIPQSAVPVEYRKWAASRVLMPGLGVDPREISALLSRQPIDLAEADWIGTLASHGITPAMAARLVVGDYSEFLYSRQKILDGNVRSFLERMAERGFEDTPPLSQFVLDDEVIDGD